jgi:hypothetical protein
MGGWTDAWRGGAAAAAAGGELLGTELGTPGRRLRSRVVSQQRSPCEAHACCERTVTISAGRNVHGCFRQVFEEPPCVRLQ